jgi:lactam utilization protein B
MTLMIALPVKTICTATDIHANDSMAPVYALSNPLMMKIARSKGVPLYGAVFADRGYSDDVTLAPRDKPGGMIEDPQASVMQVLGMIVA